MIIGVLSEQGGSLRNLAASGQDQRFIDHYLGRYSRHFESVYYFSYANEQPTVPPGCRVVPNRKNWHRWVYAFLLPVVERRRFRECSVLRVMQMTGEVPALVAKALYGTPFAATYGYEYAVNAELAGSGRIRSNLFRLRTSVAMRFADLIIVTNQRLRQELQNTIPRDRLVFVPNGVDTRLFSPRSRRAVGNPAAIVAVGRLSREKNLQLLVRAASRMAVPPVVRFVGAGPERSALLSLAHDLGVAVEMRGVVPHERLPDVLREADVFAITSYREGHPKALIEAMSCGCACVGTSVEGIRDIIEDGVSGLLAEIDERAVALALDRVVQDAALRASLGKSARDKALTHFNIETTMQLEVEALLQLGRRPR